MIDVIVHYRGAGDERRRLPAVPAIGSYIIGPGDERRLWRIDAVVFLGDDVLLYSVAVCKKLVKELATAWAAWGEEANQLTDTTE